MPSSGMLPQRRSVRLQNHDYSSGGIFAVTLVTARRRHLFSLIQGDRVRLTPIGRIVGVDPDVGGCTGSLGRKPGVAKTRDL